MKHRFIVWLLSMIITAATVSAQQTYLLKGVVQDESGEPLIGATFMVKGTTSGGSTDIEGNFAINVKKGDVLAFSYVGYLPQEIQVTGQNNLTVVLKENSAVLEDVVVVGYGTMKKKDLTGAVTQINPEKLADQNPNNVQDLLRGTAGLQVGYDTSAKGGGSLQIRGKNSLGTGSDPLIILDGMTFYGELSEINPNDIAQIDILKDASAAAVYGAKAANGVIIVTTKKGKIGKPVITLSANLSVSSKTKKRKTYDASNYMRWREDYYRGLTLGVNPETGNYDYYQARDKNGNLTAERGYYEHYNNLGKWGISQDQWLAYTQNTNGDRSLEEIYARRLLLGESEHVLDNFLNGRTYDWDNDGFRNGFSQDYNVSVSGASEKVNYYLAVGYLRNEGIVRGDNYRAFRVNMKINGKITDWLEIGANVNFQDRSDGDRAVDWGANQENPPFALKYDEEGKLLQYPMSDQFKRGSNWDFVEQYNKLEKGYQVFNSIFNAKVTLPFNITYQFNIAPRYQYWQDRWFQSADLPDSNPKDRGVNRGWSKNFDWSLNNIITWDHTFADTHHVILTLVQEAEENKYWSDNIQARNILPSDALGFHNTQNGDKELGNMNTNDTKTSADALMARLFYSFDNRYMVTATIRRDGYSAFGYNNPRANFPSVALAWNFSNESFWSRFADVMDYGKLRFSWGKNGNRSIGQYVSLADLAAGTGATMGYLDANGGVATDMKYLSYNRLANPNLRWESTAATNFGIDFGFLNSRISGSIDYYHKSTKDMIMGMPLPAFSGAGSITTNLGQVDNDGVEITLNTDNIVLPNFTWSSSLVFSYNKNRIKHLFYEYDENGKEMDYTSSTWFIGQPINQLWDYKVTGIWRADQVEEAAKYGQKPGDPIVWNNPENDKVNADGTTEIIYGDADKVLLGTTQPPIYWNFRNTFTLWKDLDISFSLYSYMGHKSLSNEYLNNINGQNKMTYGFNKYVRKFWTPENNSDKYARWEAQGPRNASSPSRLFNRNFIRLDNISVGYSLPKKWISRLQFEKVRVSASVNNVATWAQDWEYGDPETGGIAKRTFNFGVQVTL